MIHKRTAAIALPLLAILTLGCRSVPTTQSADKIVGGEPTAQSQDRRAADFTVELEFIGSSPTSPGGNCTGTIIGPTHIVTAAHCIKNNEGTPIVIYSTIDQRNLEVTHATAHPRWWGPDRNYTYDIGVISFRITSDHASAPAGSRDFAPARIAPATRLKAGDDVLLAGFGDLEGGKGKLRELYQVKTRVAKVNDGSREFEIVAGTGKGPCHGDSGGPALLDDNGTLLLVGATSRNQDGNCDSGQGTYTDVTRYQGWMKCSFAAQQNPLSSLTDDDSASDCAGT